MPSVCQTCHTRRRLFQEICCANTCVQVGHVHTNESLIEPRIPYEILCMFDKQRQGMRTTPNELRNMPQDLMRMPSAL